MSFYISHLTSVLVELKFLKMSGTPFHVWNSSTISLFDLSFFHFYLGIPNNKYFSWSRMFHNKRMFVSHLVSLCLARLSGCYWNSRLKRPDQLPVWPYYFHTFLFPPSYLFLLFVIVNPRKEWDMFYKCHAHYAWRNKYVTTHSRDSDQNNWLVSLHVIL